MSNEPPSDCPGGPPVETVRHQHLARCRCGVWFHTVMDDPVFPPHTITGDVVRFVT